MVMHKNVLNNIAKAYIKKRRMGTLIIGFVVLILLEGVLRKWVLTPIEKPLVFIREPILLLIYYFYAKDFGVNKNWFFPYFIFSAFVVIVSLLQAIYWEYPLFIPFLGIRFYLFYIPLAFIMGEVLDREQISRLIKFLLWTSIPIAILVLIQFLSPVSSAINKGLSDDVEGRFIVVDGIVRPYGVFTFTLAQVSWSILLFSIIIALFEKRKIYKISNGLYFLSLISILIMGVLSGARTYFISVAIVWFFYLFAGLTSTNIVSGVKRLFYSMFFIAIFAFMFVVVFPNAYESMNKRQENAVSSEGSTFDRAIKNITDGSGSSDIPLGGYGIGAATNAGNIIRHTEALSLGENDWARLINEWGEIMGYPILVLRTLFVMILGYMAFKVNRLNNDSSALIIFGFLSPILWVGQITSQNQILAICWLGVGLLLTIIKLGKCK